MSEGLNPAIERGGIQLIPKLIPLFTGRARVRCAWGGRGSGKTSSFALMCAVTGYRYGVMGVTGKILCARQFQNSLADSSFEEVVRAIERYKFLQDYYEIGERYIRSRDRHIEFHFVGLDRNINSIKSMGRILLCWVDEAEPVTEKAWMTLLPTLREESKESDELGNKLWQSELWVTWNPCRESAPVERRFRHSTSPLIRGVEINWRDNPLFPTVLNEERELDLHHPERSLMYDHVWEGGYLEAVPGSYYHRYLSEAESEGRIGNVHRDPLLPLKAFWDIGGTGARSDATCIWVSQFVGREIRVLDYYEARGQELAAHVNWLRMNRYEDALMVLPHDGATKDRVCDVSFESALRDAGFEVDIIPNQGRGAASLRIEAARRLFPSIWFNEDTTVAGRKALAAYHEKWCDKRNIGLGACHDWASHGSDAFGLMCVSYEKSKPSPMKRKLYREYVANDNNAWMAQ